MNDNILEPTINGLPPVTDWQKVFLALQQANEAFLRGATLKDIGKQIIGDVEIQGSDFYDLPVATSSTPVALPIPTVPNKFGFLANGKYSQPTGGTLEYSATQWGLTLFDGTKWIKKFTLDLPQVTGVPVISPTGSGIPTEKATADYVDPRLNTLNASLYRDKPFDLTTNTKWLNDGVILDILKASDIPSAIPAIYLTALRNSLGTTVKLIQFRDAGSESGNLIAQWSLNSADYKTGVEQIEVSAANNSGANFIVTINWDKLPKDSTQRYPLGIKKDKLNFTADTNGFKRIENLEVKSEKITSLESFDAKVNSTIYRADPYFNDFTFLDNGFLIGAVKKSSSDILAGNIYMRNIKNAPGTNGGLVQFFDAPVSGNIVAQWLDHLATQARTGVKELLVTKVTEAGADFKIIVDWDKIPTATLVVTKLGIDLSKLNMTMDKQSFQRIENLEDKTANVFKKELKSKLLGDILPPEFRSKFFLLQKDLEVLLVGDSLTGLLSSCSKVNDSIAKYLPPACNYNHWTKLMIDSVIRNKPTYFRYDATENTYTGVWTSLTGGKFNEPDWAGIWSVGDLTYMSNTQNASVSFNFDSNSYEKCNIIHSMHLDGSNDITLNVSGGNGKILVSADKENWVEANGYHFSQKTNPTGLTDTQLKTAGIAVHQRNRMLWMKRVSKSGVQVVTMVNNTTDFMYFWGTCFWNGNTVFITNLGRGGRQTYLQQQNISDIGDRKPDLVVYEMPLANEISVTYNDIVGFYNNFIFNGSNNANLKFLSDNFTKFQLMVILPHGRSGYWKGNSAQDWTHTGVANDYLPYIKTRMVYQTIINQNTFGGKITFGNMQDAFIHEANYRNMTVEQSLIGNNENKTFTTDGIHFSDYGSIIYDKYISGVFL
ncbi:hypothetical protein [Sphingobacterium multivorum]|uniref:hypothetical protein n=1 Tax=Sphingobacterium multivorum TaxID=28454 RepID=UPI0036CF491C